MKVISLLLVNNRKEGKKKAEYPANVMSCAVTKFPCYKIYCLIVCCVINITNGYFSNNEVILQNN
jgi:hypothetical protein